MNNDLVEKLKSFISSLEDPDNQFHFYPVNNGITEVGKQLKLGFSCYMMKIYFMLDMWKDLNQEKVREIIIPYIKKCDHIIHLAAISNDPMGSKFQQVTNSINFLAVKNIIEPYVALPNKRLVFASSCSIYGASEGEAKKNLILLIL